jgi:glucan biosynthesis protein
MSHPRFVSLALMAESAESNRPTLVKPRSSWVITSKTKPTTPIDPLDQANTPPWSTLGQRHGQTPLKPWRRWVSSGTFAAFSKIHLNTSKSTFMKVVQLVERHNFHVDWHFKFWVEIGEKCGQPTTTPVHWDMTTFKVGKPFLQKPLRKTPTSLYKSCRG